MITTFQEYQEATAKTAIYPRNLPREAINYCILGLIGESGELANHFKKCLRDNNGVISAEKHQQLFSEISDILWYCSQLATELNVTLSDVATYNINKLQDRYNRNVLSGSGDKR